MAGERPLERALDFDEINQILRNRRALGSNNNIITQAHPYGRTQRRTQLDSTAWFVFCGNARPCRLAEHKQQIRPHTVAISRKRYASQKDFKK